MEELRIFIDMFMAEQFVIPLPQMAIFVALISVFLVIAKHRYGLLIAYGYVFYWIFVLNRPYFMELFRETQMGIYMYGFFGIIMGCFAMIGFIRKDEQ